MIPVVSWGEYSPASSAARRQAEERVEQEANDKKAEKTDSASLATTAVEDKTSICQAGADQEGKEAQSSTQRKSSGEEDKETKRKFWTSTRQKMGGIFKS